MQSFYFHIKILSTKQMTSTVTCMNQADCRGWLVSSSVASEELTNVIVNATDSVAFTITFFLYDIIISL